jgi:hypothetical protein
MGFWKQFHNGNVSDRNRRLFDASGFGAYVTSKYAALATIQKLKCFEGNAAWL